MRLIPITASFVLGIFCLCAISYYVKPKEPIVYLNKEVIQGQFIRQLAEIKATNAQVVESTRRFNEVLNDVLVHYAEQKKAVILMKNNVLAGGVDITDEVIYKLSQAMRNKS